MAAPDSPDDIFLIGLDAEWVERDGHNFVLSFQWCVLFRGNEHTGIRFTDGERPTLATVVQTILSESKQAGLFHHYPRSVYVVAHFTAAELHLLADFLDLKTEVDLVRKSFITLTQPITCKITDSHRNQRTISVHFRDSMLLTPGGGSLEFLGKLHGIQKIPLPPGRIERMDLLLDENQELFEQYAIRDAEITAKHARWMAGKNRFLTGKSSIPHTLGGMAQRFCLHLWQSHNLDKDQILGQQVEYKRTRSRRQRKTKPNDQFTKYEYLAIPTYHGGRNEAFWFGPTPETDLIDIDLVSAYPTAMSTIGMPQWEQAEPVTSLEQFQKGDLGLAKVKFQFPDSEPFPSLPVRTEYDLLLFPSTGETYATALELRCAADQGAEIEILDGVRIPCDPATRPFEPVIKAGNRIRRTLEEEGHKHEAILFKELVNSLYGKTAQGIQNRTVFDSRTGTSTPLPPSQLTQPFLAAHTTGTIRAAVSSAIVHIAKEGHRVYSVSTDGILTDAPEETVRRAFNNPITEELREAQQRLSGSETIVEIKHHVRQCVIISPRGTFTSIPGTNGNIILARAGVKTPDHLRSTDDANAWLLQRFYDRKPGETFTFETLRPVREIYHDDTDLVSVEEEKEVNLEYDMKRQPTGPHEGQVAGHGPHLAFSTTPWEDVETFMEARLYTSRWRDRDNVLKTLDDYDNWEDYHASAKLTQHGLRGTASGGCVDAALRQFLRAFTRGEWGLQADRQRMTNKEAETKLQSTGFEVSIQTIKNAARQEAKLVPHSIPPTRRVLQLICKLKIVFPGFQEIHMLTHTPRGEENTLP